MSLKSQIEKLPHYNELVLPYHFGKALVYGLRYGFPAKKLRVIGVTGTNGKTSTCFMLWKMLNEAGYRTGLMTTVAWGVDKLEKQVEHKTTVDSKTLNYRIKEIANRGAEYLVLEVTSHALAQYRTLGVSIEIAIMTNVTHDHLDYHKTFERYRDAKRKLFKKAQFGVINAGDKSAKFFEKDVSQYITYGIKTGNLRAEKVQMGLSGFKYELAYYGNDTAFKALKGLKIESTMIGEFNIENSLAAICAGYKLGLKTEEIKRGLAQLKEVDGRMALLQEGQNFSVIVDFAHTPDAFERLFALINPIKKARVIALSGAAGRRDASTRAERGEIMGKEADIVIVTEEDCRDEDPEKIAEMLAQGAKKAGKVLGQDLFMELDRKKAIRLAIKMARKDDIVLLLGKGHEKTMEGQRGTYPYYEVDEAKKALKEFMAKKKS